MHASLNYVFYMQFLVLNGSEQKCAARALFVKKYDSKSILTSLVAQEHLSWQALETYVRSKYSPPKPEMFARACNKRKYLEILIAKFC